MTIIVPLLLIIGGLVILIAGAESMVRGASSIARSLGVSPLVIGLTVVAFGTSAPELIANLFAAFQGASDLSIGNITGSNISNILLILGTGACITSMSIKSNTVWKEIPFALLAVLLVFIMGNDVLFGNAASNSISRSEGITMLMVFVIFLYYVFGIAKTNNAQADPVHEYSKIVSSALTIGGMVGLFIGGNLLVSNAIVLAQNAGLSEALIGLTVVAIGTSLPELVTVVIAARHNQADIAVGNVVGSNIFNVFWILGIVSTIRPIRYSDLVNFDVIVSVAVTLLLFGTMFIWKKHHLTRKEGVIFIGLYIAYTGFIIVRG